jgi:ATP-dependent protease HslVU (ClpYQ) peptidase subunit
MKKFEEQFMGKLQPMFDSFQKVTSDNIEKQLGEIDKDWKLYEDEMTENLKIHPTLAKDVAKLYRISVPEDVLKSKYTQAALKRFEEKAASAKVQGKSSVQSSQPIQNKKMTFQESVEWAKQEVAKQGK